MSTDDEYLTAPKDVRPWQSTVLRHRSITIRRGARMLVIGRRHPTNRGEMVSVRVPYGDLIWRWGEPDEQHRHDRSLTVKTSEVES